MAMKEVFKTCEETPDPIPTKVTGQIPKWLSGSLLRNSPGKFEQGEQKYRHWFDGMALIHKFHIQNGDVRYQSKFLRSDAYVQGLEQKRIVMSEFGTSAYPDPCKSIFSRMFSYFTPMSHPRTDNGNVHLMQVGEEYYAHTELPFIRKVDPRTLDSGKLKVDYEKYVAVNGATAHAQNDTDGTTYNMGTTYGKNGGYCLIKIPPPDKGEVENPLQKASIIAKIPQKYGAFPNYFHSFAMTENYIVFVEQPFFLNVLKIMAGPLLGKGVDWAFQFHKEIPTQFHVIEKATGKVWTTKYTADALMTFHHINAYEDNGHLVMDLCAFAKMDAVFQFYLHNLRTWSKEEANEKLGDTDNYIARFVLPLDVPEDVPDDENLVKLSDTLASAIRKDDSIYCVPEILTDANFDLPRVNEKYNGRKYRYIYAVDVYRTPFRLVKVDAQTKENKYWSEENCYTSEPVFVEAPNPTSEDDGVVLSAVVRADEGKSICFLLVLDGKTFTELGRAELSQPNKVPMQTHGIYVANM
ncbi:BCO1 [Branchiostoma lanceolatum]|nr:BCO1 [Branchiostoma lanceolatum]